MRKIYKYFIFLAIISISVNFKINATENRILFKVNNEIITSVDILSEIKYLSIISNDFKKIEKNKKIELAKNSLIRQKIKQIEILKFRKNLKLENDILQNLVRGYYKDLNINTLSDFELFFKNQNLDTLFVKEKIIIDTLWKKLIYDKFSKNVKINTSEIEENILKKKKQNEFLLSEIVFSIDQNEDLSKKIKLIENSIKTKSFSEAALIHSISDSSKNGGKLGWISENILSNKIKKEIKNIRIGEQTRPITIPGGMLILNVQGKREIKSKIDVDKEIKNLIEKKTNNQLSIFSNIYLKKLKKNIKINEI